jgi:hypothetical protein
MLTVPAPILTFDAVAPGLAPRELPLTVGIGAVERDAVALSVADFRIAGLHAFRWLTPGAMTEVWHRDAAVWLPEAAADYGVLAPDPLIYEADQPQPWRGILVPAAGTDHAGAPRFAASVGGHPLYSFRARFEASDGESGWSPPSPNVAFASLADTNLMTIGPGDGEELDTATIARIELKSPALATIGGLVIRRAEPGAEIVLGNAAGAAVVLQPDGSIELRPAPGRGVRVTGDLETERIHYAPAGGGPKTTLG